MKYFHARMTTLEYAYAIFSGLTVLNFLVFVLLTLYLGGDAVNGTVENGHYYLWGYNAYNGKKGYTEVSARVFQYSKWHVYTTLIMWAIMLAGVFLLKLTAGRIRKDPRRN